jgi:predicted acyl esterase
MAAHRPSIVRAVLTASALFLGVSVASAQAVSTTVAVTMADGVKLSTDVWRPLFDVAKHPVVLRRTPYGRTLTANDVNGLVSLGYVVVSQDVRGRGNSEGTFVPFTTDKEDGKATIDWIAQQDFASGKVGTYSGSAEGIVQYMAMAAAPAALSGAYILMATHDVYEGLFPGGAWRTELGTAWLTTLNAANVVPLFKSHEVKDDYWNRATLTTTEMAHIEHPVFLVGGMYDIFSTSEVRAWHELEQSVAPASKSDVFLVLGPWTHAGVQDTHQGSLQYPADAAYTDYLTDFVSYFGWCLQGQARPSFPPVRYYVTELTDDTTHDASTNQDYVVARGAWKHADSFPPPGVRTDTLYLRADALRGDEPPASAPAAALALDPSNPVPSVGGGNLTSAAGPHDQKDVDARPDVLVAATAPMTESVEIVGSIRARIFASSATTDADVIVRVEVVTPGGRAIAVTDGIRRGRFVTGYDAVRPLVPGAPTLFDITTGPLGVRLPPGHRLRVAISGTSAPRYEPNPNRATELVSAGDPVATTLTIYRDRAHPSRIDVPVASGTLPGVGPMTDGGDADGAASDAGADDASVAPASGGSGGVAVPSGGTAGASSGGRGATGGSPSSAGGASNGGAALIGFRESNGCDCRASGKSGRTSTSWSALTLALLGLWRRTRARRKTPARDGAHDSTHLEGVYGVDAGDALAADERHRRMVVAP